jgi:hypothetical protein
VTPVYAFAVYLVGAPWPDQVVNAHSRGKARAEYFHRVRDALPDTPWMAIRCRKVGAPRAEDPRGFARACIARGVNFRFGEKVRAEGGHGVIVRHNSSGNFDVLFDLDSPVAPGRVGNVHPGSIEPITEDAP